MTLVAALASCGGLVGELSTDGGSPDAAGDSGGGPTSVAPEGGAPIDARSPDADASAESIDAGFVDATIPDAVVDDGGSDTSTSALPSTAPCLVGGDVLWVDGDPGNNLFSGTQTVSTGSMWAVSAQHYTSYYDGALLEVHLADAATEDPWWYVDFSTDGLSEPMQTGIVYEFGEAPVPDAGEASFMIEYALGCQTQIGSFRVDDFVGEGDSGALSDTLVSFTAAFVVWCAEYPGSLRGCIHYGP